MVFGGTPLGKSGDHIVNLLSKARSAWEKDHLLRQVVKNSSYLFSSSTLGIGLNILTSIFSSRALGVASFGVLGAITTFAAVADKLLSFRIGELVVKYSGAALTKGDKNAAAAVFKVSALTEITVSFLSYLLIVLFSPFAATYFAKDASLSPWFMLYGLIVPAGLTYETSSALLQITGKYRFQAIINFIQNLITTIIVAIAFFSPNPFPVVVIGYLAGKTFSGFSYLIFSLVQANKTFGEDWWKVSLNLLPPRKEFWGFAFSSNFSGTVNLFVRDSDILWVNYFLSPLQGGYYKLAVSLIGFMLIPIDPFIKTSFPEITRTVTERSWAKLRKLLQRLTLISGGATILFGVLFAVIGKYLIALVYGEAFVPAWAPAMILFFGYGFANIFFWNRPLLLALGKPYYPMMVTLLSGSGKILLSFLLISQFGINAQAIIMTSYFILSISLILQKGYRTIKNYEKLDQADKITL